MFDFLKHFALKKTEDVQTGFMQLLVQFDPEGATEAEIGQLDEALTKITVQMIGAKKDYDRELKEAQEIQKNYDLRVAAAERLQTQMDAEADAAKKAAIEKSLATLVADLEQMLPKVEREAREADEAKSYCDDLTSAVKTASERLKTARANLSDAQRRMNSAQLQARKAAEQEERAKMLAGITKQATTMGTALEAMTKRAEDLETQAAAHKEKAALLTPPKHDEDPLIAQALRDAAGEKPVETVSLADRLAALKKK
jgi:chromosome segregation ATPase